MKAGIERLKMYEVGGSTHLSPGLEKVRVHVHDLAQHHSRVLTAYKPEQIQFPLACSTN